ncbi:D-alanyl-D-alanine carboxypeptidase family protein [Clostridium uliginosum]|uniref:serine-type D-Ala-D-Ala carboxypeptidase n=1 Tax=Clostridium uliginosum TaxID=119641 RepID=A0A1I1I9M0_9CLOT|nr:D-alanyl-D-alanine carboxypeptidase family protein [Clostridium uliginosum]SFC30483.1 D-alanyl-D-alanine carboxypeptidase [Clostridium uliginosum]
MKNIFKIFSALFLCLVLFPSISAKALTDPPQINAEGSVLMDASTGKILYSKNGDKVLEPASTTKVMTAIIALEKCKLDDEVTIEKDFTQVDGTTIGLLKGDVVTVHDLLLGLLLESGNDAAEALAYHISSSLEDFAILMNDKAKELGALHTNFKNPSGLPDPEHVTTANDLALIMREAIKNKDYIDISNVKSYEIIPKNDSSKKIWLNNKNYMINQVSKYYCPYAISGKNGYTTKSNHTYTAAAQKNGHVLVASFLNALDKNQNFQDMKTVFNYGFDNFVFVNLYKEGQQVDTYKINDDLTIPLLATKDIDYVIPKDETENATTFLKVDEKDLDKASFNTGDVILKGTLYLNNEEFCSMDLASGVSKESSLKANIISLSNKYNLKLIITTTALIIGALSLLRYFTKKKRKRKKSKH